MEQQKLILTATEGMKLASAMLYTKYIAMRAGMDTTYVNSGMTHSIRNGKPHYYNATDIERLQSALHDIASDLARAKITDVVQFEEDCPLCYGVTTIEKIKNLCKAVRKMYLFGTIMGKEKMWVDNRISCGNAKKMKIRQELIDEINAAVQTLAARVAAIELTADGE